MTGVIDRKELTERFMRYVRIDTQSDPNTGAHPSTEKQKDLSRLLTEELKALGLNASTDEFGYVYAKIPANTDRKDVPVIAFCSHVDTAPDFSGSNVQPILHKAFTGDDIQLPNDKSAILSVSTSPYLKQHIGKDIITSSGDTLLGADDKSGVAIIMQAATHLVRNPEIKHGEISIVFTPDEEIGEGVAKIDMQKVGAQFGYTLDGGEAGSLEDESFSADAATITIQGVITHPGYAKGKLVNALKIAGEVLAALPKNEWSPETTSGKEGFVHPLSVTGIAENATIGFIVRDFSTPQLEVHHERLKKLAEEVVSRHPGAVMTYEKKEQYRNMKDILNDHPQVVEYAAEAIRRTGLGVITESIRGGTDGSRLSYMGLPCPNIFTGMQNIHSRTEWIGVEDMLKSVETVVELVQIWEEES